MTSAGIAIHPRRAIVVSGCPAAEGVGWRPGTELPERAAEGRGASRRDKGRRGCVRIPAEVI